MLSFKRIKQSKWDKPFYIELRQVLSRISADSVLLSVHGLLACWHYEVTIIDIRDVHSYSDHKESYKADMLFVTHDDCLENSVVDDQKLPYDANFETDYILKDSFVRSSFFKRLTLQ